MSQLILRVKVKLCVVGLFMASLQVNAAGYDCSSENLNNTESAICNNSYLSSIDNSLNKFFSLAVENSLHQGTLFRQQQQWIKERNQCADDIACIKEKYLERNKTLTGVDRFRKVDEVFIREGDSLDLPMRKNLKNKNGFTMTEEPWRVKLIIPNYIALSPEFDTNMTSIPEWKVLTHRIINGDLFIYFLVSGIAPDGKWMSYIVRVDDTQEVQIIASYLHVKAGHPYSNNDGLSIIYEPVSAGDIVYSVYQNPYEGTSYIVETYKLDILNNTVTLLKSKMLSAASIEKDWTGYCENRECSAGVISPDGKWRLASSDGYEGEKDEGVFYFPADKPDQGVNVFLAQGINKDYGHRYTRNYVWGDETSFYFDNEGEYACIWRTDIISKLTQRILPIEGMHNPYYLKYNDEEMIVASYTFSRYSEDGGRHYSEVYIAKK